MCAILCGMAEQAVRRATGVLTYLCNMEAEQNCYDRKQWGQPRTWVCRGLDEAFRLSRRALLDFSDFVGLAPWCGPLKSDWELVAEGESQSAAPLILLIHRFLMAGILSCGGATEVSIPVGYFNLW